MPCCRRFLLVAALLSAPAASGGALFGEVVDSGTGRPIAGALVTASGDALQGERMAQTDASGVFELSHLPPGAITLDVQAKGYQSSTRQNVAVHLDATLRLRLELQPEGSAGAAVGAGAQQPVIAAPSAETAGAVARDQTELVPYGRERLGFEQAANAIAGVLLEPGGLRIAGTSLDETRYLIDGADVTDPVAPRLGTRLAQRFVEEVRVVRGVPSAESGRAAGAILHATTRSGGNEFHGSVFGDLLPFELSRTQPGDPLRYAGQLGVDLGGPIQRDRLWFYAGLAPETVATSAATATDLQYVGKLTFRPAGDHTLALSAFGDPGSGAGSNDLSLRYFGNASGVLLEGTGSWHHARAGADRVEGALSGGGFVRLLGHHRLKAGADLARESAGAAQQTLFAAFAQDSWGVLDAVWLDAGVRYQEQSGLADASVLLPRLGLSYDFTGRGLSRIYAAWGRFFQPAPLGPGAGLTRGVDGVFSSGAQYQFHRDMVASIDYSRRPDSEAVTLAVAKPVSENYLLQASTTIGASSQPGRSPDLLKLDAAYAYEWTPKTTVSLGLAVHAADSPAWRVGLDARAALRYALTSTWQLALNLDVLNALNQQADAAQAPLAARLGGALSF
jgi:hypothetical protein